MSKNIKTLVYCSACTALFTITSMMTLFSFPTGGSVTLFSMLFATLPGYFFGPVAGITSGIACGALNFILKPYMLTPVQVILDYILAFGAFGLSGFFSKNKNGLILGYIVACIARWFFSFLSGWIFFGEYAWSGWNPALYSAVYNIIYIGAEALITLAVLQVPALADTFRRIRVNVAADSIH